MLLNFQICGQKVNANKRIDIVFRENHYEHENKIHLNLYVAKLLYRRVKSSTK